MSDAEVAALRGYLLTGGVVAICGGASSPLLYDPRWRDILPLTDVQPQTFDRLAPPPKQGFAPLPTPVTLTVGTLTPGSRVLSSQGQPLALFHPVGAGGVVLITFDPTESPASGWPSLTSFLRKEILAAIPLYGLPSLYAAGSANVEEASYQYGVYTSPSSTPTPMGTSQGPFNITLPPTLTIFEILAVYFFLVVPLNLLILRKFRKGELAWATAPIISLLFAGIFFKFAGQLYAASLSKRTFGTVVIDPAAKVGRLLAKQDLFFPSGGSYDLKWSGVEQIKSTTSRYSSGMFGTTSTNPMDELQALDIGEIIAPHANVPNLSFLQYQFEKPLASKPWVETALKWNGKEVSGTIRNLTPFRMKSCAYVHRAQTFNFGNIEPGQTVSVHSPPGESPRALDAISWQPMFTALFDGMDEGAQVGKAVGAVNSMRLVQYLGGG